MLGGVTAEERQGYVSVEMWLTAEGGWASRITDARASPHRHHEIFEDAARLVDRDEVFPDEAKRAWVFETVDQLAIADLEIAAFLKRGSG